MLLSDEAAGRDQATIANSLRVMITPAGPVSEGLREQRANSVATGGGI